MPALVLVARVPIKLAVGTSLVVITVNAGVAYASNAWSSPEAVDGIAWSAVAIVAGFGLIGSVAGERLSRRLPATMLRKAFAVVLALVAAGIVVNALRA